MSEPFYLTSGHDGHAEQVIYIPAFSLWQPWASLMADGRKPWETRHWKGSDSLIGKEIAIHAAMKVDRDACEEFGYDWHTIPRGAILSTHRLSAYLQFTESNIFHVQDPYGDYSVGRWGWLMPLIRKFEQPIPAKGHQGIWNWERA
jgi:hypothetical protein